MRRLLILSAGILLLVSNASFAQHWSVLTDRFANSQSVVVEFLNRQYGFVFPAYNNELGPWHEYFYRTTDGGATWDSMKVPFTRQPGPVGAPGLQVHFENPAHGVLSIQPSAGRIGAFDYFLAGCGVFETLDSGNSWRRVTPDSTLAVNAYTKGDTIFMRTYAYFIDKNSRFMDSDLYYVTTDHGVTRTRVPMLRNYTYTNGSIGTNLNGTYVIATTGFSGISTDGGTNWISRPTNLPQLGVEDYDGGLWVVPYSSRGLTVESYGNSVADNLWKTTDNGLTWSRASNIPLNTTDRIAGALDSCGPIYMQSDLHDTDPGMLRSDDFGASWRKIGGTIHGQGPDGAGQHFNVCGNGAVVVAVDLGGMIYVTTDGGDGTLNPSISKDLVRSFSVSNGDTIHVGLCDTLRLRFSAGNMACNRAWLDSATLSSAGIRRYRTHLSLSALAGEHPYDTATIVALPSAKGVYPVTLTGRIRRTDWQYEDSTIHFVLIVDGQPGILSVSKQSINFGAQTLCSAIKRADTIRLSATGCEAVQVDSIVFRPADGTSTDFGFISPTSFAIGSSDKARAFPITFKPTHPAKESGVIYIYSSNGVDSITVTGEGVADSRAFIADRDTLRVQMCDSSQGVFRLTNTTCGSLVIDSVTLADGVTLPLASNGKPQLPLALGRDQQEDITIRNEPSVGAVIGASSVNVTAHVRYLGKGDTVSFDTVLTLPLVVSRGIPSLALTEQSLDLGEVSTCAGDTVSLGILSDGCDTLQITSASLASGSRLTLVRQPKSDLATGTADSVSIAFAPSTVGTVFDTLILQTNAGVRSIPITATGVSGDKIVAQSTSSVDFGPLRVCQDSSQVITLTNKGCADITLTNADLTGQGFAYDGSLPIALKPGGSTSITVHSVADTTGHPTTVTGTLQFTSTAQNSLPPITLRRGFMYPAHLKIEAVTNASAKAGEEAKFKVLLEGDVPKGMSALYFDLSNDDDLLSFVSSSSLSVQSTTGGTPVATRTFRLSPVTDTGIIGELTFHTYLAKASTTSLTLSNLHFDYPNLTVPPDCIASIEGSGSDFTYIYECGEGLIQKYMLGESLAIESVAPNPASKTIEVKLRGAERLSMIDVLGREVREVVPTREVTLDVSALSPGTYYLRAVGAGGVRTARVVVSR